MRKGSRPVGVNLKPEQRQQMTELYLSGMPTAEIARQLGVAKSTVSRHTLREGLRGKLDVAGKRLTEDQIAEIKKLYQTTMIPKEHLAKRLGVSFDSIHHHTQGLSREIPADVLNRYIELYLEGVITADYVKDQLGIGKHDFYSEIAKEVNKDA